MRRAGDSLDGEGVEIDLGVHALRQLDEVEDGNRPTVCVRRTTERFIGNDAAVRKGHDRLEHGRDAHAFADLMPMLCASKRQHSSLPSESMYRCAATVESCHDAG